MPLARTARLALLAAAIAAAAACRAKEEAPAGPAPPVAEAVPAAPERAAPDAGAAGSGGPADDPSAIARARAAALRERLATSPVVGAKPISPRSLSVKVALASGERAVWKPLRKTNRSARYEVAFSKLAPLVGAPGTPEAVLRRLPLAQIAGLLEVSAPDAAQALRDEALAEPSGAVGGAIIEWIADLGPGRFQGEAGWRQLAALVAADGPAAAAQKEVADASRMIVADYVAGNWDRFSGGNLFANAAGDGLRLIDNNGSFAPWSDKQRDRMDRQLAACARFSASQIELLRALTAVRVRAALAAEEARGVVARVLTDAEVALLLERRDAVLRRLDAAVAERGAAAVIVFP